MEMLGGGAEVSRQCRTPQIMADAAYVILTRDGKNYTGNFAIDEHVLKEEGCKDFSGYLAVPGTPESDLLPDFFLDMADIPDPMATLEAAKSKQPASGSKTVQGVFDRIAGILNEELVSKVQAVYTFKVKGDLQPNTL